MINEPSVVAIREGDKKVLAVGIDAKEMIGKLTIKYNKERQAQITKELIEITSGKEALASQEA